MSTPAIQYPLAILLSPWRLRAVVALDDDEIEFGLLVAQPFRRLVIRPAIAAERCLVAREFQHHGAATHGAFDDLAGAAAHQETAAELAERRHVGRHIGLVAFGVRHIAMRDPVTLAPTR